MGRGKPASSRAVTARSYWACTTGSAMGSAASSWMALRSVVPPDAQILCGAQAGNDISNRVPCPITEAAVALRLTAPRPSALDQERRQTAMPSSTRCTAETQASIASSDQRPASPSETNARCRSTLARRRLSLTSALAAPSRRARRRLTAIVASSNAMTTSRASASCATTDAEVRGGPLGADTSTGERRPVKSRCSRILTTSTGAIATPTARSMRGILMRNAVDIFM